MQTAIIDLGTNTCNLLIAEIENRNYKILYQGKEHVKLVDKVGLQNNIGRDAIERTITALNNQKQIIDRFNVSKTRIIATSSVRTAYNQTDFIKKIHDRTGLEIEVISDQREAELIYKGVILAFQQLPENMLILDIGGGSNELIISGKKSIKWMGSFPAGVSRVVNKFKISDPIKEGEIKQLASFYEEAHMPALEMHKQNQGNTLIGCSGAFDTIADIIDHVNPHEKVRIKQKIELTDFPMVYQKLLYSTKMKRKKMKGMDSVRLELIVPAVILINTILENTGITEIYQTDYALREGVLFEILRH